MIATAWPTPCAIAALGAIACSSATARRPVAPPDEVSAEPWETRPCTGAATIPPDVDELLTRLASPARDHCEVHRLGDTPALFVRTMATVAHDDRGDPIATCHWEVFRASPDPARHLGSLSVCRFRIAAGCAVALDRRTAQRVCAGPAP